MSARAHIPNSTGNQTPLDRAALHRADSHRADSHHTAPHHQYQYQYHHHRHHRHHIQVGYLNKALAHFDAGVVVPTHFALFALFSLVGPSILYHELSLDADFMLPGVRTYPVVHTYPVRAHAMRHHPVRTYPVVRTKPCAL